MPLADLRREYTLAGLRRSDLHADPIVQFTRWFDQAAAALASATDSTDINAMTLATADREGRPSARVVLLKGVDERGFVFFTNYQSRKGRELAENPNAALVFYWAVQERQVTVAGTVTTLGEQESEVYFNTRPRASRLAAWASRQSEILPDRAALEAEWQQLESQYPGDNVPKPPFWGGYILSPARIEFWQGRPSRLHDRFRYTRQSANTWKIDRLSP
jgi:pyridoxamine 5'-phosphate oxidase